MSLETSQTYKTAHQTIIDCIDQILPHLRAYSQARPKLRAFHQVILSHFGRQNKELFDRLIEYYKEDREKVKLLEFFLQDSKDIKIKFLVFFDKHSGEEGPVNARAFPRDFQGFIGELIEYIKREEEYLVPLIEKAP